MSENHNILYSWNYHDTKHRGTSWYIVALSLAIGLVIWGFLTRQYGMSIVIMLVTGIFYFLENNSEDYVQVEITELGIKIQNVFYDYSKISGYSLVYQGDQAVFLRLFIQKKGISVLSVRTDNTTTAQLRSILPHYIEEKEDEHVSLIEKIIHHLKL